MDGKRSDLEESMLIKTGNDLPLKAGRPNYQRGPSRFWRWIPFFNGMTPVK
jgi:hypothetical protein